MLFFLRVVALYQGTTRDRWIRLNLAWVRGGGGGGGGQTPGRDCVISWCLTKSVRGANQTAPADINHTGRWNRRTPYFVKLHGNVSCQTDRHMALCLLCSLYLDTKYSPKWNNTLAWRQKAAYHIWLVSNLVNISTLNRATDYHWEITWSRNVAQLVLFRPDWSEQLT